MIADSFSDLNHWSRIETSGDAPWARSGHTLVSDLNGSLFLFGGYEPSANAQRPLVHRFSLGKHDSVMRAFFGVPCLMFRSDTNRWEIVCANGIVPQLYDHTSIVYNGSVWVRLLFSK